MLSCWGAGLLERRHLSEATGRGGPSAKRSGHWDAGCECCIPDPIFKFAMVLSCYGYALRYWGAGLLSLRAAKAFSGNLKCWGAGSVFGCWNGTVRKFSRPKDLNLANPTWSPSFHPASIPRSPSTRERRPVDAICSRSMQRFA